MDADALSTLFLNLSRIHWYNMALRGAAMPVFFEFEYDESWLYDRICSSQK